jgi:tryptophanyl-tRNA synthetase
MTTTPRKKRLLSGMRPTGKLHLGNLVGALENWVVMQEEFESYHLIADYHALTTNPDSSNIAQDTSDMVVDWLAAGIDPAKAPIFRQSQIKEHAELFLIFGMLVSTSRLERNPTLKDQVRDLQSETISFGHLGYPVLQAADVLLYRGEVVPVGEDQLPHLEITRELARRFNAQYGTHVFAEPEPRLTRFARMPGLDRNKMSKSLNNAILMSDGPDIVFTRLRTAITDEQKLRKNDPGRPEVCLVYTYHQKFNPDALETIGSECRSGALGCVACKTMVGEKINAHLAPMIERRRSIEATPNMVQEVLATGEARARVAAAETMTAVRSAMHLG